MNTQKWEASLGGKFVASLLVMGCINSTGKWLLLKLGFQRKHTFTLCWTLNKSWMLPIAVEVDVWTASKSKLTSLNFIFHLHILKIIPETHNKAGVQLHLALRDIQTCLAEHLHLWTRRYSCLFDVTFLFQPVFFSEKLNQSFHLLSSSRTTPGSQSNPRWNPAGPGVTRSSQSLARKLQLWDLQDNLAGETSQV